MLSEGKAGSPVDDIRAFLRTRLPEYMVPSVLVELDRMPVLPSGKIDHLALPTTPGPNLSGRRHEIIRPRGEIEERLSAIWQEVSIRRAPRRPSGRSRSMARIVAYSGSTRNGSMMCTMPISVPVRLCTRASGSSSTPQLDAPVDQPVALQQHQPRVGAHQQRGPERQQHAIMHRLRCPAAAAATASVGERIAEEHRTSVTVQAISNVSGSSGSRSAARSAGIVRRARPSS